MDLKDLGKKLLKLLFGDTTAMVLMMVLTGYWLHATMNATTVEDFLWGAGITLVFSIFAHIDLRRRDRNREAAFVLKLAEEGECADGCCETDQSDQSCCQDGHCEMEDATPETEAKPEKKVC